jgi:hypothetical protein
MRRAIFILALATFAASGCAHTYDYDPASAGDQEGSAKQPRGKTSDEFLRSIYADLLGRTPQTYDFVLQINGTEAARFKIDESSILTTTLDGVGDSTPMRALVVNGMLHGAELQVPDKSTVSDARGYITDQFKKLLGREPNPYELQTFADAWSSDPAVGPRTIIRAIVGSREYQGQ